MNNLNVEIVFYPLSYFLKWYHPDSSEAPLASSETFSESFLGGSGGKESACHVRNLGLIPGSGRYPGEGNGYPLQYSCLENFMGSGA